MKDMLRDFFSGFDGLNTGLIAILFALVLFSAVYAALKRYVRCPADKILVISGRVSGGEGRQAKCVHGGGAIVWPILQEYQFLDLEPITVDVALEGALTRQNIRVNVPSSFTLGISTTSGVMENAAQRLLGLKQDRIKGIANEIIIGQLRAVLATMSIEEINTDREGFMTKCTTAIGVELNKVGLQLINVNIKDIVDESGYIKALGQKAAAEAVQNARMDVAKQETTGGIGVAEAEQQRRVQIAAKNAEAVKGENEAAVAIANSKSEREVKEAEAHQKAEAAKAEAEAGILKAKYEADEKAEVARAGMERQQRTASEVVAAEVAKAALIVTAEADAQAARTRAAGEADARRVRLQAEADGVQAMLKAQADGIKELVAAAGGKPEVALGVLMQRQLPEIAGIMAGAIKNVKFDKVVVMGNGDAGSGVAQHVQGLFKMVPGLQEMFETCGMDLPEWLARGGNVADLKALTASAEAPKDTAVAQQG